MLEFHTRVSFGKLPRSGTHIYFYKNTCSWLSRHFQDLPSGKKDNESTISVVFCEFVWLIFGSVHWEWKKLSLRRLKFLYLEVKVYFWRRDFLLDLAALLSSFSLSWAQKPWEQTKKSWRYGICLVLVLSAWILCQKRCKLGRSFIQWLEVDFKGT